MEITVKHVPVYDHYVEIDIDDADRSDLNIEISGNYVNYNGTVNTEVDITIDEVVVDLTEYNWTNSELQDLCEMNDYQPDEAYLTKKFSYELVDELISRDMSRKDTLRIIERLAAAKATTVEVNDE